jgi:hypothetical protein
MPQSGQTTPTGGREWPVTPQSAVLRLVNVPVACTLNHLGIYVREFTAANANDLRGAILTPAGVLLYQTAILSAAITSTTTRQLKQLAFSGQSLPAGDYILAVAAGPCTNGHVVANGQTAAAGLPTYMSIEPEGRLHPEFPPDASALIHTDATREWDMFLDWAELPPGMLAAARVVSSASAALSSDIRMGANAASIASSSAALATAIRLAANAVSAAAATGTLNSGALLQANALDVVTLVAALSAGVRFNAQAIGRASANGALTNWATVTLSGTLYHGPGGVLDPNFWMDSVPTLGTTIHYDPTHIAIAPNGEISSDSNSCAALMQFYDGTSWALGLLVITPHLVAYADDVASASAQLSTAIELAAAATALANVTAAFSTGVGIAAQASDVASASGSLRTGIPLSALAANVSVSAANLTAAIRLQAAAIDTSTATANVNGVISLDAAATAITSLLGSLTTQIRFGALAADAATAGGSLTTGIRVAASAQNVSAASGALATAIRLGGSANNIAVASGNVTTRAPIFAAAIDVATAIATMSTGISLRANAEAITRATAVLGSSINLLAGAVAEARSSAVLTDVIETPPIGVYASDPRYVVAKTRWAFFGQAHTPRFAPKDQREHVVLTFDLAGVLAADESLEGPIELTIIATSGTDGAARAVFAGYPAYDMTKRRILMPVQAGVEGCDYYIKIAAATSNRQKYLALAGLLPIRG